jgi:hypothetical protein
MLFFLKGSLRHYRFIIDFPSGLSFFIVTEHDWLVNTRAVWKVISSDLLAKQAMRGKKIILYKQYIHA